MRESVAKHATTHRGDVFLWDAGKECCDFLHTAMTDGAWGDGRHLAIASRVHRVRIIVAGDYPYTFGDEGPVWTVRFDAMQEHYDMVADEEDVAGQGAGSNAVRTADDITEGSEASVAGSTRDKLRWGDTGYKRAAHQGSTYSHLIMTVNVGGKSGSTHQCDGHGCPNPPDLGSAGESELRGSALPMALHSTRVP